jgi:hypothetical protein
MEKCIFLISLSLPSPKKEGRGEKKTKISLPSPKKEGRGEKKQRSHVQKICSENCWMKTDIASGWKAFFDLLKKGLMEISEEWQRGKIYLTME